MRNAPSGLDVVETKVIVDNVEHRSERTEDNEFVVRSSTAGISLYVKDNEREKRTYSVSIRLISANSHRIFVEDSCASAQFSTFSLIFFSFGTFFSFCFPAFFELIAGD